MFENSKYGSIRETYFMAKREDFLQVTPSSVMQLASMRNNLAAAEGWDKKEPVILMQLASMPNNLAAEGWDKKRWPRLIKVLLHRDREAGPCTTHFPEENS